MALTDLRNREIEWLWLPDAGTAGFQPPEIASGERHKGVAVWGETVPATFGQSAFVRPLSAVSAAFDAERGRWELWIPVLFGTGIGLYFASPVEPAWGLLLPLLMVAIAGFALVRTGTLRIIAVVALLTTTAGFCAAKLRSDSVAAPRIERPTGGVVLRGTIEEIEPRLPKGVRLTILVDSVEGKFTGAPPRRVRVRGEMPNPPPDIGDGIEARAVLLPPTGPVLPDGYDFARLAYFNGIGAGGFLLEPPRRWEGAPALAPLDRWRLAINRFRHQLTLRIEAALGGERGSIAAATITGERGGISDDTNQALRDSGLSHLLAISGFNMAIMAGAVFALVRGVLALVPAIALRFPIKKWAAVGGLAGATFCWLISGSSNATERAYIMVVLGLGAVILDRPAVSLRNVALAGLVMLALKPESLLDVSFQMSFAAVIGLVATYDWIARRPTRVFAGLDFWPAPARFILLFLAGTVISTIVAGVAVDPLAAFHFHRLALYGTAANLVAVPIFTFIVMPLAILAIIALPFGLEWLPLQLMSAAIDVVLWVAHTVAGWKGASIHVPSFPAIAAAAMMIGLLWLAIWQGRWRWLGLFLIAGGFAGAATADRPDLVVAREGRVVAVRGADGALTALPLRGQSMDLDEILTADGDERPAKSVATGSGFGCDDLGCVVHVGKFLVALPQSLAALDDDCRRADILIGRVAFARACGKPQLIVPLAELRRKGTHTFTIRGDAISVRSVGEQRNNRPWSGVPANGIKVPADPPTGSAAQ